MDCYATTREALPTLLATLRQEMPDVLYRGLCERAEEEFSSTGELQPKAGDYSVGKGVFFTDSPTYASSFMYRTLLLARRMVLDSARAAIDTRQPGHYRRFEEELKAERGEENYTGWDIEERVQRYDTITQGPDCIIYTSRTPIKADKLTAMIRVEP